MAAQRSSSSSRADHSPPASPSGKTKRARTKHACDECRRSQKKCDGERPICQRCYLNGTKCSYTPHKSRGQCECAGQKGAEVHEGPVADVYIFPSSAHTPALGAPVVRAYTSHADTPVPSNEWASPNASAPSPHMTDTSSSPPYTAYSDSPPPETHLHAVYPTATPSRNSQSHTQSQSYASQGSASPGSLPDSFGYQHLIAHPTQHTYAQPPGTALVQPQLQQQQQPYGCASPYAFPHANHSSSSLYDDSYGVAPFPHAASARTASGNYQAAPSTQSQLFGHPSYHLPAHHFAADAYSGYASSAGQQQHHAYTMPASASTSAYSSASTYTAQPWSAVPNVSASNSRRNPPSPVNYDYQAPWSQ